MDSLTRECRICNKEFDHSFEFKFCAYHKNQDVHTRYDFSEVIVCSRHCISSFAELLSNEKDHEGDAFVATYSIPIGFCDKCGDATHPTEFCELFGDVTDKDTEYYSMHLSGQGSMVKMEGEIHEIFLGPDWMIKTKGFEFRNDLVQLEPDLKKRAPLALVWNNVDEYSQLAETICIPDSRHEERKRFNTSIEMIPNNGERIDERYYYVIQTLKKLESVEKIFFPFYLHSVNCWFPIDSVQVFSFERYFKTFQKSDYIYQKEIESNFDQIFFEETEDVDANYEAFMKGLEILQNKEELSKEIKAMSLSDMEKLSLQEVYEGEGRRLVDKDENDNVITDEDIDFLESRGFSRTEIENFILPSNTMDELMDEAFIEQMRCNEEGLSW